MNIIVVKRDGTEVQFDKNRITNAIFNAAKSVGGTDKSTAVELTDEIVSIISSKQTNCMSVEDIQDIVEKTLIENGHAKTAKEYILYRQRRTDARNLKGAVNKVIGDLIFQDAEDNDDKRENANINSDAPMGAMLKIGETVVKEFSLINLVKPKHAMMHRKGMVHIHDFGFFPLTLNCVHIPLDKLLDNGYSTGHGTLRTPADIKSASTLTCIAIQSSQNDFFQHHGSFM